MAIHINPDCNASIFINKCAMGEAITSEMQSRLFEKAVKGTEEDIDFYILNNTRLVTIVITNFFKMRRSSSYLFDDMFSAGLLALTRSAKFLIKKVRGYNEGELESLLEEWSDDGEALNIAPYLYVAIYRDIREVYERDSSEPLTERRRNASRNLKGTLTRKVDVGDYRYNLAEDYTLAYAQSLHEILSIAKTPTECLIMKLRLDHNDNEIAEIIGMSTSSISRIRDKLHQRLCKDYDYEYHKRAKRHPAN